MKKFFLGKNKIIIFILIFIFGVTIAGNKIIAGDWGGPFAGYTWVNGQWTPPSTNQTGGSDSASGGSMPGGGAVGYSTRPNLNKLMGIVGGDNIKLKAGETLSIDTWTNYEVDPKLTPQESFSLCNKLGCRGLGASKGSYRPEITGPVAGWGTGYGVELPITGGYRYSVTIPADTIPGNDYRICRASQGDCTNELWTVYNDKANLANIYITILSDFDVPTLTFPANGAVVNSVPKLKWSVVSGAEYYPVSSMLLASSPVTETSSSNEFSLTSIDQTYAWTVAACKKQDTFPYSGDNTLSFKIGKDLTYGSPGFLRSFDGSIDELKIYNRGLSTSEVSDLFNMKNIISGLAAYWSFNEGTGINVADSSGNNNNAIINEPAPIIGYEPLPYGVACDMYSCDYNPPPIYGKPYDPTWVDGKSGKAVKFNHGETITVPNSTSLNPRAITISVWIKTSTIFGGAIVAKSSDTLGYVVRLNENKTVSFFDRGNTNTLVTKDAIPVDQWTHIAATGDTSGLKIYINGQLSISGTKPYGGDIVENCTEWSTPWTFTIKNANSSTQQQVASQTTQTTTTETLTNQEPTTQTQQTTCDASSYGTQVMVADLTSMGTKSDMCGSPQYYKVSILKNQTCDLKWTLQPDSNSDFDLYANWKDGALDRNSYDDRSTNGKGQQDELSKTGLSFGDYYAMAYKETKDTNTGTYSITPTLTNCKSSTQQTTTTQQQTTTTQQTAGTNSDGSWCYTFTTKLKYKETGYAVGALQAALRYEGLLNISKLTTYFGLATKQAVIAFQEKYKDTILMPSNLIKGTGYVGTATIKKLNELYGCK